MKPKVDSNSTIFYPSSKKDDIKITVVPETLQWSGSRDAPNPNTIAFSGYKDMDKALNPYYGSVGPQYYASTGMPWLSADARKAVLTEWFWQPIRGQPRRVDTNELRKYSQTVWVQAIEQSILNQICSTPYVIVPKKLNEPKDKETQDVNKSEKSQYNDEIEKIEEFFASPNKNNESFSDIVRAWLKDVLELDAGVIVKVYSIDSFDFEHLEPRSGAPLLKPLECPICGGKAKGDKEQFRVKANRVLKAINSMERKFPSIEKNVKDISKGSMEFQRRDYTSVRNKMEQISQNSDSSINSFGEEETPKESSCPFCNGTGQGRHLTEIYARDGSSFLWDTDRTGYNYGAWQYSYSIPAHPMWFGRDEIIYFKQNNRSFSPYGFSAVQSSLDIIKSLESSVQHNKTLFIDGAVPDGIVGIEDMSNEELARMKTVWENDIKGQPHKVVFVNKRSTFQTFAFNNRDMQFLEGQKEAWNQVIANFNMTPSDLGITRDVNRSSATAMGELTKRKCIRPLMTKIENLINTQLLPELGAENVEFQFIVHDPSEERQLAEISEIMLRNNLKTVNEVREDFGLEPLPDGDMTQREIQQETLAMTPSPFGNEKPASHHKPGEIREQRDPANEGAKRERESESNKPDASVNKAQEAFQAQIPFNTMVQNLSQPVAFALPKTGHPNTQSPYKELNGLCPKCGSEQFAQEPAMAGSVNGDRIFRCHTCQAHFNEEEFKEAVKVQEEMHSHNRDVLAPNSTGKPLGETVMSPPQTLTGDSIDTLPTKTDPFKKKKVKLVAEGEEERNKDDYKKRQLELEIKTELEHTSNKKVATKIAMDHLDENPDYYSKLIESGL